MKELYGVITEVLEQNEVARIKVTGSSMYPFLRDGIDSVELRKVKPSEVKKNDIVMIRRDTGEYIVHRIFAFYENEFYLIGDAEQELEGPLLYDQLIARVSAVYRKEKRIECNNFRWRILSRLWMCVKPFRYYIFKVYGRIRRVV